VVGAIVTVVPPDGIATFSQPLPEMYSTVNESGPV
jgi:hypothetical protein